MTDKDRVNETILRWRETPAADLKPEDYEQFKDLGRSCLAQEESEKLLEFLHDENNQVIVRTMGSVLLSPLLNVAAKKDKHHRPCQAAITHLTTTCSPEEVVNRCVQVIEDVDPGFISDTIITVIPHLQAGLLRLVGNQASFVGSALSALHKQLTRLPVPYSKQQEEDDEYGLCRCCSALAAFIQPFAEKIRANAEHQELEELKSELLKFCMRSLREPLLEADMSGDRNSPLRLFATELLITMQATGESTADILFYRNRSILMPISQSQESRACLSYLLFVQLITYESFPSIYSPVFVLQSNMENVSLLLSSKKESHLLKGLALFEKVLQKTEDNSLPVSLLELQSSYRAIQNLKFILTDCPIEHLRESGLQILQMFINKLDYGARQKLFRCLLMNSNHPGLEGFIVKNIKSQVELSLSGDDTNHWTQGRDFLSLLQLVFDLPHGAETNLLYNMDRYTSKNPIMESLNLLRFLLIRNKITKEAEVWREFCQIKDGFLRTLRVSISMSRSYYSSELKTLTEDMKLKAREMRACAGSTKSLRRMIMKHKQESNLTPAEQHQVLQSALVTFDLMESLIFRIDEITEENLKMAN
ncbi:glomulin, FKBP associated protein b [Neosynchiropus ocellatus]